MLRSALMVVMVLGFGACRGDETAPEVGSSPLERPSILLVTLDTTRADVVEPGRGVAPTLAALAGRGVWFEQAYATAPQTLPSHVSMLTGLLPAEHGVHENARVLREDLDLVATRLAQRGYRTGAFVSAFTLEAGLGLARGFESYNDTLSVREVERPAAETTDAALAWLDAAGSQPIFLWVHYFDPHDPYQPPEPFATRFAGEPYLGEVAAMDAELGRLLAAFEGRTGGRRILVVGDHGESLGEHGEATHGNLLYQGVMRVPLVIAGDGIAPGRRAEPVSTRRVFDTLLGWAGGDAPVSLENEIQEMVFGEAMQPYLSYGWSPQVMVVKDRWKLIRSAGHELYDVINDPAEANDLAASSETPNELDREQARAARDYPLPDPAGSTAELSGEELAKLASLGYVSSSTRSAVRPDAPSPRSMVHLLPALERGSALFANGLYRESIPLFADVLEQDPHNLMVAVRLGVAHSLLGEHSRADEYFDRARALDAASVDVMLYHALHLLRSGRPELAEPQLELVLARDPGRVPALEALAQLREQQGRLPEAVVLLERLAKRSREPLAVSTRLGNLLMALGRTTDAIRAFERARELAGAEGFSNHLELGVLYLAARRFADAAAALDQVPSSHPGYEIALFKRAQVSVLLREPDAAARINRVRSSPDPEVQALAAAEQLFR